MLSSTQTYIFNVRTGSWDQCIGENVIHTHTYIELKDKDNISINFTMIQQIAAVCFQLVNVVSFNIDRSMAATRCDG